ncbi:MAG: FAD-dependent oxidoreductase [Anaerolineaceae bacterium]|nr:FAD-dependent oxidoreductase [Anaerolineaceae bacterium]
MKGKIIIEADVVVIGGGITGVAIGRELSKYKLETIIVEKAGDVAAGQSKLTLGHIYTGLNMVGSMVLKSVMLPPETPLSALYHPNSLLTKWSEQGFNEWLPVFKELGIKHGYSQLHILAKDKDQIEDMQKYIDLGEKIGGKYADFKQVDREEILDREPNVNKDVMTGLYAKDHIIDVFPPEVVIAMAENAVQNGVTIMLNAEVSGIYKKNGYQMVQTTQGAIKTEFIVNAAGGFSDRIADMAGGRDWNLQFKKTQFIVLDRRLGGLLKGTVRWPNKPGLIQLVQARDDNILIECGTYDETDKVDDIGTIRKNVFDGIAMAQTLVPAISAKDIIRTYTGVRLFNTRNIGDHIVEFSPENTEVLNVIIRLPGFIGSLPMSRHVVSMLGDAGLDLITKSVFNPFRKAAPTVRALRSDDLNSLIGRDYRYGRVICRCETVAEGEIIEAIRRGATTIDGVKFRTRASMGRCQGNFCSQKIANILARELGQDFENITKKGKDSNYVVDREIAM